MQIEVRSITEALEDSVVKAHELATQAHDWWSRSRQSMPNPHPDAAASRLRRLAALDRLKADCERVILGEVGALEMFGRYHLKPAAYAVWLDSPTTRF